MRKLIGKALALALLIGCFVLIPSPRPTRADWAGCDADRSAGIRIVPNNTTCASPLTGLTARELTILAWISRQSFIMISPRLQRAGVFLKVDQALFPCR